MDKIEYVNKANEIFSDMEAYTLLAEDPTKTQAAAIKKGQCLGTRINEHKLAIRRRDPLSLVFAHALESDHRFDWDGSEVVAMANIKRTREFLEAWYSSAGSINRHVDLDADYEGLRSRMTAPCPNHASTTANTAARIPTDSPPALPLQHGVPRLKNKDLIAVLKDDNGVKINENSEKAEHFGQYFASVFTRETEFRSHNASNAVETAGPVLDSMLFWAAVVERELKNLKEATFSGPDNIPVKFLKELANELSKPLAHIFCSSVELGRLQSEWKAANICPLYKGRAFTNANNYRPASLTCIRCKVMKAIVKKATMKFLEQNHLLSDLQHGFRQNRSCIFSLLLSTEHWTRALDEDGRVDVIYTDSKKAFDSVPHKRLI
nr:unnamed protein product [Spirometra erinaceieuropaei]